MWALLPPIILLAIFSFFGAYSSTFIKSGTLWPYLIYSVVISFLWIWIVKISPYNLIVTTIIWDIVFNLFWVGTMVFILHEMNGITQAVGAGIVIVGLIVMGIKI
jgi:uncharacterized membrane protein